MNFDWGLFVDLGLISAALLVATALRAKIRFFQRFLVPNSLTAGFLLLIVYNACHLSTNRLESLVFHLLGMSFVAMTLRKSPPQQEKHEVLSVSLVLLMQHIIQAAFGLAVTALLIVTIRPDLFPGFGMFYPLGFALGPGQALAFGAKWEAIGFHGAPSIGITFAAIGFLYACFGGVILIQVAKRKGWLEQLPNQAILADNGLLASTPVNARPVGMFLTTHSDAIDALSINLAVVLMCYWLTYLLLKAITALLALAGKPGLQFADSLWVITYVFAGLVAMIVKVALQRARADAILDNGALTRISGFSVDYLVAGSLGVVSLMVVRDYWLPILLIISTGTVIVVFFHLWVSSRIFQRHVFLRTIIIYGAMTGTLPTGLALLRVLDPEFETPVASDHMYAAGLMFPMAIPFILMTDFPANWSVTHAPIWIMLTVVFLAVYLIGMAIMYRVLAKERAFASPFRLWFTSADK